ncbi:hypothetical protein [Couchioplanes azureus]|uniref:hypothetical protein n=1 Tax=Couchioplanes caeruleus TaxID=56438 RepID=UPI0016707A96|nr:hypothetical protein [Couchioplanes caeruleus]GGQ39380.1 hypothetical protein GCM10010166_02730 [Couchioplanes caeruleus subsp. azureus]
MSDFDAVLERLLTDPAFQAQLARDPGGALAGYTLDAGEVELLHQQVAADAGASQAAVEDRVSKSSTFGLFGSFGGIGALTDSVGSQSGPQPVAVPADGAAGIGPGTDRADPWSALGAAAGRVAHAAAGPAATEGFGDAPAAWGTGGGVPAQSGLGSAPGAVSGFGDAPRSGFGDAPPGRAQAEELRAPKGYTNRVDVDGDGRFDEATYRGHRGGGAEVLVDLNGDGKTDFIGVDEDLDRVVDYADYDNDHDGRFEERMYDSDGDGWLDRSVPR